MNFLNRKCVAAFAAQKCLAAFAALMMLTTSAFANQQADTLSPLNVNDARIVLEKGIEDLKNKIKNSKNLSEEERIKLANEIEESVDSLRNDLTTVVNEAVRLADTAYVAGIILSYTGEFNIPTEVSNRLSLAPGAELGLAIFLRNNAYVSDAFSGAVAVMGGGSAKFAPGATQRIDKGLKLKVLIAANRGAQPMIKLQDFAGVYAGVGAEANLFTRSLSAQVFTRPTTCASVVNPLSCSVYMVSIRSNKDYTQQAPVEAAVKGIYLDFPYTYGAR